MYLIVNDNLKFITNKAYIYLFIYLVYIVA